MISKIFPPSITSAVEGSFFSGTPEYCEDNSAGDAFSVKVTPTSCTVRGGKRGLLYASDLLADLKKQHGAIPCAEYSDAPDTVLRCYHLDLKKGSGGVEDIKRTFRRLRSLRYNSVLVEYENRIVLDSLPGIAAPDAFTREEIGELNRCAAENGLEIIPLLQSLGHLEYLLNHPDYKKYAEDEGGTQLCPSNTDAFELWKKVFDEMRKLHPEAKTFHIGGDETRHLGECPECAAFAAEHSVEELFFRHIDRVCRHAVLRGCRPMLWHDMLSRARRFDLLAKLPAETVIVYWSYEARTELTNAINLKEGYFVSREWMKKIRSFRDYCEAPRMFTGILEDNASETVKEYAKNHATGDDLTHFTPLPALKDMRDAGLNICGASSLGYPPNATLLGDADRNFSNVHTWIGCGVDALIITRWASSNSVDFARGPASLQDLQLALSAELMWDNKISREEAERRYDDSFGANEISFAGILNTVVYSEHEKFINWAEYAAKIIDDIASGVPEELEWIYKKHRSAVKAEFLIRRINSLMRNQAGKLAERSLVDGILHDINATRERLREDFKDEYPEASLEEWMLRLFQAYEAMFEGLSRRIQEGK